MATTLIDWHPALRVALSGLCVALGPLTWIALKHRQQGWSARWRALAALTVFLTFDLVVFGAYTRLSDSGLGCPDWPGCYGSVSPVGAHHAIAAAQQAQPMGPVTHTKAWIEMIHRYLATCVGVLITVLMASAWWSRRREISHHQTDSHSEVGERIPVFLPSLAWVWVGVQGAFGMLTVTLKLYPAVVSMHLFLALGLLVILTLQTRAGTRLERWQLTPQESKKLRWYWVIAVVGVGFQIALGAWVSTNYAVLACTDFPKCLGHWWPAMDFAQGFALLRELGHTAQGDYLNQQALTAIHMAHRWGAVLAVGGLIGLAVALARVGRATPSAANFAKLVGAVMLWQLISGLSNVVLGWPLMAALAHTAGAAAMCVLLTLLWMKLPVLWSQYERPE